MHSAVPHKQFILSELLWFCYCLFTRPVAILLLMDCCVFSAGEHTAVCAHERSSVSSSHRPPLPSCASGSMSPSALPDINANTYDNVSDHQISLLRQQPIATSEKMPAWGLKYIDVSLR